MNAVGLEFNTPGNSFYAPIYNTFNIFNNSAERST